MGSENRILKLMSSFNQPDWDLDQANLFWFLVMNNEHLNTWNKRASSSSAKVWNEKNSARDKVVENKVFVIPSWSSSLLKIKRKKQRVYFHTHLAQFILWLSGIDWSFLRTVLRKQGKSGAFATTLFLKEAYFPVCVTILPLKSRGKHGGSFPCETSTYKQTHKNM